MAEHDMIEGIELSDEVLEDVAGGVLPDSEKQVLRASLAASKANGYTLEQAFNSFMRGHGLHGDPNDYIEYADEIWDTL